MTVTASQWVHRHHQMQQIVNNWERWDRIIGTWGMGCVHSNRQRCICTFLWLQTTSLKHSSSTFYFWYIAHTTFYLNGNVAYAYLFSFMHMLTFVLIIVYSLFFCNILYSSYCIYVFSLYNATIPTVKQMLFLMSVN